MNTLATRITVSLVVLSVTTLSAQVAWTQVATTGPSARARHRMVYDSHRQRIVVFRGLSNETWEWDGTTWSQRFPTVSPSPRDGHGLAYDSVRRRVVLFGGESPALGDTWEYDGSTWLQRTVPTSPSPRWAHAMTFDSVRGVVVMHGGARGGGMPDTWEYDGTTWTQRFPTNNPRREEHTITFDEHRGRVVMFGGRDGSVLFGETLEWDGNDWVLRATTVSPPARSYSSLAYDLQRRRTVLFGGFVYPVGPFLADTWEWDGTNWLQRAPLQAPVAREHHALVYDAGRGEVLLFGGSGSTGPLADTWRYAPTNPASYAALGTGCAGTAGTPALAPLAGHLPWLGDSFTMQVRNLPATAPVVYLFGNSSTAWGSLALPADLTPIGMTACVLRAAGLVTLPMLNQAGTASITFAIPNVRYLVRAPFYDQAFVFDQQANPFGATLSNAGELRFGER